MDFETQLRLDNIRTAIQLERSNTVNRQQRRAQKHERIEMVDLRKVIMPGQMSVEECRDTALYRLGLNLTQTGHPFHHLTANGAIVGGDPTLEYLLSRLHPDESARLRARYGNLVSEQVQPAIAVNRMYYGHDPYLRH